jgi:large repetitive protein
MTSRCMSIVLALAVFICNAAVSGGAASAAGLAPRIVRTSPGSGVPGQVINVIGQNFDKNRAGVNWVGVPPYRIQFKTATGWVNGGNLTYVSPRRVRVTVPSNAVTGQLRLVQGPYRAVSPTVFTMLPTPSINGVNPSSGQVGSTVTLTGSALERSSTGAIWSGSAPYQIQFTGTSGFVNASFTVVSPTQLTATVPAGAGTGPVRLVQGSFVRSTSGVFTVVSAPPQEPPTLSSFSPSSGVVGSVLTVDGANLNRDSSGSLWTGSAPYQIQFTGTGGFVNATFAVVSPTQLTVTVPAGAATGPVRLVQGAYVRSTGSAFTVVSVPPPQLPAIGAFSPNAGVPGAVLAVDGTNLNRDASGAAWSGTPPYSVQFQSGAAFINAAFTVVSPTRLNVTVPAGAGSGALRLVQGAYTSVTPGSYTPLPQPALAGVTPGSGIAGTTVTVAGTNLDRSSAGTVWAGTAPYKIQFVAGADFVDAPFTFVSASQLSAVVPVGATTGTPRLVQGEYARSATGVFTVLPTPDITGFSPSSGSIGQFITIAGSNFNRTKDGLLWSGTVPYQIQFSGVSGFVNASVTYNSPTQLTVQIPTGAIPGIVRLVQGDYVRATSSVFAVNNPPPTPTTFRIQNFSQYLVLNIRINGFEGLAAGQTVPPGFQIDFSGASGAVNTLQIDLGTLNGNSEDVWFTSSFPSFLIQSNQITTRVVQRITVPQVLTNFQSQARFRGTYFTDANTLGTAEIVFFANGTYQSFRDGALISTGSVTETSWANYSSLIGFNLGNGNTSTLRPFASFLNRSGPPSWPIIQYTRQ